MELRHLRYFVVVAEELNFTRAAARLQMAQPPLSQQIRRLEAELGVRLFNRTSRAVSLTPEGEAMLSEARDMLQRAVEVEEFAGLLGEGRAGVLRIGSVPSGFSGVLPELVPRIRAALPEVVTRLYCLEPVPLVDALAHRSIDIALTRTPFPGPEFACEPIVTEPFLVALPRAHPLAARRRIHVAELADWPFVLFPRAGSPGHFDAIVSVCEEAGFSPAIAYEATDDHVLVSAVACGIGVSLVPRATANLRLPGVRYRSLAAPVPVTRLYAAWHRHGASAMIDRVLDLARAE